MYNKDLQHWLSHIESFHPSEIELGLERIKLVANELDILSPNAKIILVAGTNGKGSCVALLESMALTQNKKVATYTSPHLLKFNERIRINGKNIEDAYLVEAFEQIESVRGEITLTFFEFTTLAALSIFKQAELDLIVLEVGLGGRQDATNIIDPDIAIITTVDKDHSDWLGDDLESIAFEKGGIIRSNTVAFVGDSQTYHLLKKVLPEFSNELCLIESSTGSLKCKIEDCGSNPYRLLQQNIMLAKSAFQSCFGLELNDEDIFKSTATVSLCGRFQLLDIKPKTLVDVAHNHQSALNLHSQLVNYKAINNITKITAICGMMADKAIVQVLQSIDPVINEWCFVNLDSTRAIDAISLQNTYSTINSQGSSQCFSHVKQAFEWIVEKDEGCDNLSSELILVFGSFITVSNMLQYASQVSENIIN